MKPIGKEYEKLVAVDHTWECIPVGEKREIEACLVTVPVSKYIRELEERIKQQSETITMLLSNPKTK